MDNLQTILKKKLSLTEKVKMIKQHHTMVGKGNSRIVFVENDEHYQYTVIKIADKNSGLSQNKKESQFLSKGEVRRNPFFIKMIDYDRDEYTWIQNRYASKMTDKKFIYYFGNSIEDVMCNIMANIDKKYESKITKKINIDKNEYCIKLYELCKQYHANLDLEELKSLDNWGIYNNHPTIIDLGL